MKKSICNFLLFQGLLLLAMAHPVLAQTTALEKKTDTVARMAIRYMNSNLPDSVYALAGDYFRSQISAATWSTVYNNQLLAILPFTKFEFVSSTNNINTYKLTGKIMLTYNVSIDSKNKLVNFSFVPYKE